MTGDAPGGRCVYTALFGGYEELMEQPAAERSGLPFICLTEDPALTSRTWQIRVVEPVFPMDPARSQRVLKMLPHEALPEFEASLYIDNTVSLVQPPEALFDAFGPDAAFGVPSHSFRETVLDEFVIVARLGRDDQSRIFEQLNHYLLQAPEVLDEAPFWNGILLRRRDDETVRRTMRLWLDHVFRYSRRDQLSLNFALRTTGLRPSVLAVDNHVSPYHEWPRAAGRDAQNGERAPVLSAEAPTAKLRDLRGDIAARSAIGCELKAERARAADLTARVETLERALHVARVQAEEAAARSAAPAEAELHQTTWRARLSATLRRKGSSGAAQV